MKKRVRLTENDIRRIVKSVINEAFDNEGMDKFTKDMNRLFHMVDDEVGGESIKNCIAGCLFDFDKWDNESRIVPCRYSENGMYGLLYKLFNYDLICINQNVIDVRNSNHPNIARLVKPYANSEMCQRIYDMF